MQDVLALVGHARPHLVDVWDALAVLEASGYTDARVSREFGLTDTRELAEQVYAQLAARPLPAATPSESAAVEEAPPRLRATVMIAVLWAAVLFAAITLLRVPAPVARLALLASVVVCCGFVEATRRRGAFYAALDQPQLARITCWYFMRLAAIAVATITIASIGIGWLSGATWPAMALWADTFVVGSAVWLLAGARQVPAMRMRKERRETDVPIPRMTVVAFLELRVLVVNAVAALIVGALAMSAAGYAALGIIGAASATFVVSTMIGRWWLAKSRSVSVS